MQLSAVSIQTHVKSSVPSIPVPGRCFAHVHIDLVVPLPSASGQSYIFTMIDRTGFYLNLDLTFWCSCSYNLWPWNSVHILHLGQSLWNVKNFSFYHHQYPLTIQRDDWTFSLFFKILPSSSPRWAGLGSASSFSSPGSLDNSQCFAISLLIA